MLQDLFELVHPTIIHFSIVGFIMGFILALIAYFLLLMKKKFENASRRLETKINFLENVSLWNLIIAEIFLPFVMLSGIIDAGGIENTIRIDLLALKLQLSFFLLFISISPIILKVYSSRLYNQRIFTDSAIVPIFYLIPLGISNVLILLIASLGGRFAFNHTLFDNVGLGFLIPDSVNQYQINDEISFLEEKSISPEGIFIYLLIFSLLIVIPYLIHILKNSNQNLN